MESTEVQQVTQGKALDLVIWLSGYTHAEVAEAVGVSRSHISNIINDNGTLTKELCDVLADFLGVMPTRLGKLEARARKDRRRPRAQEGDAHAA